VTILIFSTGKVIVGGTTDREEAKSALQHVEDEIALVENGRETLYRSMISVGIWVVDETQPPGRNSQGTPGEAGQSRSRGPRGAGRRSRDERPGHTGDKPPDWRTKIR
jgi:hypothetical protein